MKKPPPTTGERVANAAGVWLLAFFITAFVVAMLGFLGHMAWKLFWMAWADAPWVLWTLLGCAIFALLPAFAFAFGVDTEKETA